MNSNQELLIQIKDINKIQELSSKETLNNSELNEMALAMGFESYDEYLDYTKIQKDLLISLNKDYNLTNYDATDIYGVLYVEDENVAYRRDCGSSCDRTYRNCMGASTAAAFAAHAGCIGLDPMIIGGIICHGAALAVQYFVQDECGNQGLSCHRGCIK